jgi:hypothetical protein
MFLRRLPLGAVGTAPFVDEFLGTHVMGLAEIRAVRNVVPFATRHRPRTATILAGSLTNY